MGVPRSGAATLAIAPALPSDSGHATLHAEHGSTHVKEHGMKLTFFGAAGEVTGSCHLVEAAGKRILLDCGMIQSGRDEDKRNAAKFGFDLNQLDAMILSHAHIDHVGRLPLLRKRGYRGPIYTQRATKDLSKIMLEDSARLAEADVEYENRRRARRGLKALEPLYDEGDVEDVLRQLKAVDYDKTIELFPGLRFRLRDAGHIIGAAIVELWADEDDGTRKLVFSGDIGPKGTPILRDPSTVEDADLVMLESTYKHVWRPPPPLARRHPGRARRNLPRCRRQRRQHPDSGLRGRAHPGNPVPVRAAFRRMGTGPLPHRARQPDGDQGREGLRRSSGTVR